MRGHFGFQAGQRTRKLVYEYFERKVIATQVECARDLGISRGAVNRACIAIKNGWKPEGKSNG